MKSIRTLIFSIMIVWFQSAISQDNIVSIRNVEFHEFMAGVKFATVVPEYALPENGFWESDETIAQTAIFKFLEKQGIKIYKTADTDNPCDIVRVTYSYNYTGVRKTQMTNLILIFTACDGMQWKMHLKKPIFLGASSKSESKIKNISYRLSKRWKTIRKVIPSYHTDYRRKLLRDQIFWNELAVRVYLDTDSLTKVEGIYEVANSIKDHNYRLALIKENGLYKLIYLSGSRTKGIWVEGDIKAFLYATATERFFKTRYFMADKSPNEGAYIELGEGMITVRFPEHSDMIYLKIFPNAPQVRH